MKDYVTDVLEFIDGEVEDILIHFAYFVDGDPITFEEASSDEK